MKTEEHANRGTFRPTDSWIEGKTERQTDSQTHIIESLHM